VIQLPLGLYWPTSGPARLVTNCTPTPNLSKACLRLILPITKSFVAPSAGLAPRRRQYRHRECPAALSPGPSTALAGRPALRPGGTRPDPCPQSMAPPTSRSDGLAR